MTSVLIVGALVIFVGALLAAIDLVLDFFWGKTPKRKGKR